MWSRMMVLATLWLTICGDALADENIGTELRNGYTRCGQQYPGTPVDKKFHGLKSVGLFINRVDEKELPQALKYENLVNFFSQRIREEILPFLVPDSECNIPDVVTFHRDDIAGELFLSDFSDREDTLLIVVDMSPPSATHAYRSSRAVISLRMFRNGIVQHWNRRQFSEPVLVIPFLESESPIDRLLQDFSGYLRVSRDGVRWPNEGDPMEVDYQSVSEQEMEEFRSKRTSPKTIPLSDVSPWKNSSPPVK